MTNKLPVVGKIYKNKQNKHDHLEYKITQIIYFDRAIGFVFENGENFVMQKKIFTKGFADTIDMLYEDFFKAFEELPEDKVETELDIGREILNSQNKDAYNKAWSEGWAAAMESKRNKAEIQSLKDAIQNNLQRFEKEKSSLPIWVVVLINQLQNEIKTETKSHSETKTRICPVCKIDYSSLDPSHYCSPDCQVDAERLAEAMKSDEVRKAMEFLRLETKMEEILYPTMDERLKVDYRHLASAAKNLLNALDKQFNNQTD